MIGSSSRRLRKAVFSNTPFDRQAPQRRRHFRIGNRIARPWSKDAAAPAGPVIVLAGATELCDRGRNFLSGEPAYLVRWEDNIEGRLTKEDFKS
jgi:hypothetical protein